MKTKLTQRIGLAALLMTSAHFASAQTTNLTINTFDTGTSGVKPIGTGKWYGSGTEGVWDDSEDATGNGGGSLYIQTLWGGSDTPLSQYICTGYNNIWYSGSGTYNLSEYVSLQFDIKWDPNSTITLDEWNDPTTFLNGSLGGDSVDGIQIQALDGVDGSGLPTLAVTNIPAGAASGWVHMTIPIDPGQPGIDPGVGFYFKKWLQNSGSIVGTNASGIYTNTANFWIDNVILEGNAAPLPPPTMTLAEGPAAGLNLITLGASQYNRHSIRTIDTGYSFYNAPTPTTYSYTLSKYPGASNPGFQTHIFLVPNAPAATVTSPDWNAPDVIWLNLQNDDGGGNYLTFTYKTNFPNTNWFYFNTEPTNGPVGNLGSVSSTTVEGNWGMTIENNTNVTIFSPTSSTNIVLPAASAAMFDAPLRVYVGSQANQVVNQGLASVLSRISITGAVSSPDIIDVFAAPPLDTNTWEIASAEADGIVVAPSDSAYWLEWTVPDTGFSPQSTPSLTGGSWTDLNPDILGGGAGHRVLLTSADLPGTDHGYWRLLKREFTRLQILLPGESPAPGTPSGKTGTPDPQDTFNTLFVTVRAVDDDWNLITGIGDNMTFGSTDGAAFLPSPGTLINGQQTFEMLFGTPGVQTVSVTNLTDGSKLPNTSSPVTVN